MSEQPKKQFSQATQEVLLVQLQILNERSRWYSGQLWQIPFLYLTITGAFVGQVIDKAIHLLSLAAVVGGLLGFVVAYHMGKLKDGEERAVKALIEVESSLKISHRAEHRKEYTDVLLRAVQAMSVLLLVSGIGIFVVNIAYPFFLRK